MMINQHIIHMLTSPRADAIRGLVPESMLVSHVANQIAPAGQSVIIYADICSIRCYQYSKIGLADVTFITEQTNTPELISFVQRSVDMEDVNVKFQLVQFTFQMIPR